MSSRLSRNLYLLKLLYKSSPKQRGVILHSAPDELILALCEVALNILHGKIPLTAKQLGSLKRRKTEIKYVANKKINIARKRRMINQKGGFLLPLLSIALPFITSLITRN